MFSSTKQTTCVETKTVPSPHDRKNYRGTGFASTGRPPPPTSGGDSHRRQGRASERARSLVPRGEVPRQRGGRPSRRGASSYVSDESTSSGSTSAPYRHLKYQSGVSGGGVFRPSFTFRCVARVGGGWGGGRRPRKPSRGKESERKTHRRHEEEPKKKSRKKSRKEPTCNQRVCAGNPKTRSSREKKTQRRSRKREDVEGSRQLGPEPRTLRGGSPQRRGGAFSGPGTLVPFCPVHAYLPRVESLPAGHEDDHVANTSSVGDTDAGSIHAVAPSPARAPRTFPGL